MGNARWGYRSDGRAAIFDSGVLADGWSPDVAVIADERLRTAESLSARMERNPGPEACAADDAAKPIARDRGGRFLRKAR
jgi:hypothetical protein